MSRTDGEKISRQKYESKAYDQILIKVKKGKREEYRQSAELIGLGQMEMIRRAIEEFIANHAGEKLPAAKPEEKLTADEKKLVEEFCRLPVDAQKYLLKFVRAINCSKDDAESDN